MDVKLIWFTPVEWAALQDAMKDTSPKLAQFFDDRWRSVHEIEWSRLNSIIDATLVTHIV